TPSGGRVTVAASRETAGGGDKALVQVSDSGIGIPPDEVPQLFGRFFRATNARSAVIPGTGLGLAIVQDIVTQHQGTIDVTSTLGAGTTFVIRLPVADR
ncbi:MAG: hypothetical protein QOD45_1018, partial [Pseudonocardiales bacterium]|nr:hypothetical protein [Pseudonocardiales bacterium]